MDHLAWSTSGPHVSIGSRRPGRGFQFVDCRCSVYHCSSPNILVQKENLSKTIIIVESICLQIHTRKQTHTGESSFSLFSDYCNRAIDQ
ncbi:copine-C [Trichinella spiralis]|uniref:copine-C n=1 Tax=Trichinella spiralis TaxID=6334 RepID=UPI0001EFC58B|nr:copine-C [Trichinella spiralis]